MAGSPGVSVRLCPEKELPVALELARACYGAEANPLEWWRWRYFGSYSVLPVIYVAELAGQLVGMTAVGFFRYSLHRRALTGALFTDVMVHPEHRRKGVFSKLTSACVQAAWQRGADFIGGMPSDLSLPGFVKAGWTDIGDRAFLVCPLRLSADAWKAHGPSWTSLLMTLPAIVSESRYSRASSEGTVIEEVQRFDSTADVLADEFARSTTGIVLLRDSAWLNWRYCEKPGNDYRRFVARTRDGTLLGVAVTKLERRFGIRAGFIVELTAVLPEARRVLIGAMFHSLREQGAEVAATVLSDSKAIDELRKLGLILVPRLVSPKKFHTIFLPRPENADLLAAGREVKAWYLTLGDWDAI
jgi:GNAT superfamily N-acetyltransferase